MHITSRLAPLVVLAALLVPTPATAAERIPSPQACPPEGCNPGDPGTFEHTSTFTVSRTVGTVVSDTVNGHAISCGSTCSLTDTQVTDTSDRPTDGWFTYGLSATGGPSGFTASWGNAPGCGLGPTCAVLNDQASRTVTLSWMDTTPPSVTFNPPTSVGPANFNVSAGASDNSGSIAHFQWTVDSVAQGPSGSQLSLSPWANGEHTVGVRAYDAAGNESSMVSRTVLVDKTGPTVDVNPVEEFVNAPPTLAFSTDEGGVTHSCVAASPSPGPARTPCSSPWTLAPEDLDGAPASLPDGPYTLQVTSTDSVGNSTTATRETTLDRTDPVLGFTQGPAEGSSIAADATDITFDLTETNPHQLTCTIDDAPVGCAAGSPVALEDLAEGAHVFTVAAVDKAGNQAALSRHFQRQRDAVSLTATDVVSTYGRVATLRATGLGGATGNVRFVAGSRVVCSAPISGGAAACGGPATLTAGRYTVTASYDGDGTHAPATDQLLLTVRKAATTVNAKATPRTADPGERVRLTARVGPGNATGAVVFRAGRVVLCRATVRKGVAACRTPATLVPGAYRVVARYLGSRNYAPARDTVRFKVTR